MADVANRLNAMDFMIALLQIIIITSIYVYKNHPQSIFLPTRCLCTDQEEDFIYRSSTQVKYIKLMLLESYFYFNIKDSFLIFNVCRIKDFLFLADVCYYSCVNKIM